MNFVEALQKSMTDSKYHLFPVLEKVLDGEIHIVEGDDLNETKRLLDTLAGIDLFAVNRDKGMRGIASRLQWGKAWRTFTIRKERESGARTEYEKRKYAIEHGYLYPKLTMQAYIDQDTVTVGIAYTEDIIRCIEMGEASIRRTGTDQKGQAYFYVINWDDMKRLGMRVWEKALPTAEAGANKLLLCGSKFRFEAVI